MKRFLDALIPLPMRNEIRLALHRHPRSLRGLFPAVGRVGLTRRAVVFDVGAHVGSFAECVLAYRPHARLHAFEPQGEACRVLRQRLSGYPNVVVQNVALGREKKQATLNVREFTEATSFLDNGAVLERGVYGLDFSTTATVEVPVVRLSDYVREQRIEDIELLKLDVQGYELEVLAGAEEVLDRVTWIYTEAQFQELYRGGPLFTDLYEHLGARGFELVEMTAFKADDGGRLMESDMLFRRRAR